MIDSISVLKRNGNAGELRIGESITIDDKLDANTLFLRTASFNTGRFPQEPTLRALMEYLQNSYVIEFIFLLHICQKIFFLIHQSFVGCYTQKCYVCCL